ncbi:unnamed protein product [Thelazia callipaeda]|uniref:mannosyl-oligosaccharide 1,3-1,6-alpha-mannosidase n=1 Tax=Thelazia callipaeda TaxID=103827 RepID=A0A0N5D1I4_THECL|nr:unnamed protein product [Thelazia callipaeda]
MLLDAINYEKGQISQNYYKRRKKNSTAIVDVYVMPFSHVDPGWLETFSNYLNNTNAILDNMVIFLKQKPRMRFLWCEIAFFERWWSLQNETTKNLVRRFVSSKQLEIASGSWVMTDEANTYFPSIIDNIIEGQQFVYSQLNVQARVMWSNDPFGYSSSVPYLFANTGVKRAVINRIHHNLKLFLREHGALSFRWRQFFDAKGESDMYTQVLPYNHYDILNSCGSDAAICCEFDFKRLNHFGCPDEIPVVSTQSNIPERASKLEKSFLKMSSDLQSNVLLSVWGDDFRYALLEEWHQQYDNLIVLFDYINKHSNRMRIRFGTLTEYFDALEKNSRREKLESATLSGDFFPYKCPSHDYWTGYYTTRPFYKRQERDLHSFIRAADLLSTSALRKLSINRNEIVNKKLTVARRNLALFQHHDAITGTSKNHVMKDYSQRMFESLKSVENVLKTALDSFVPLHNFEIVFTCFFRIHFRNSNFYKIFSFTQCLLL